MQRLGALPQREDAFNEAQGPAQEANIDIGTVEAIERGAESPAPGDEDPRVGLTPGDAQIGIFLVVLQQHIEVRLVVLDQVGLQGQRLRLAVGDDELDLADLAHHQGDAGGMAMATPALEVAADPVAQHLGLTDVEDSVLRIAHQVAARLGGDLLQAGLEPRRVLQQCLQPPYCQPVLLSSSAAASRWRTALFTSPTKTV